MPSQFGPVAVNVNTGALEYAAEDATQAELDAHDSDTTSVHGITNTALLATTGANTFTAAQTVNNNTALQWKDSGGTGRRTQLLTGGNNMMFGDVDNALAACDLLLLAGGTGILKAIINGVESFYVRNGFVDAVAAELRVITAGRGLRVAEGANAKQGASVLVGGTVVVANTSVTANSRILLTSQVDGGTPGWLRVSARTAATSFTITSSSGTDTSTVGWLILEPA